MALPLPAPTTVTPVHPLATTTTTAGALCSGTLLQTEVLTMAWTTTTAFPSLWDRVREVVEEATTTTTMVAMTKRTHQERLPHQQAAASSPSAATAPKTSSTYVPSLLHLSFFTLAHHPLSCHSSTPPTAKPSSPPSAYRSTRRARSAGSGAPRQTRRPVRQRQGRVCVALSLGQMYVSSLLLTSCLTLFSVADRRIL